MPDGSLSTRPWPGLCGARALLLRALVRHAAWLGAGRGRCCSPPVHATRERAPDGPLRRCRAAYVGVNTWDLMDKSRDSGSRPEIQSRLDAMVKAGWSVGRTWGFSLGNGLSDGPLGHVIADPSKILETAPGARHAATAGMAGQDGRPGRPDVGVTEGSLGCLGRRQLLPAVPASCAPSPCTMLTLAFLVVSLMSR